jgi:hypothetical protein
VTAAVELCVSIEELAQGKRTLQPNPEEQRALFKMDWGPALQNTNSWYDRLVAALWLKERAEREKELNKFAADFQALKKQCAQPAQLAKLLLVKDPPDPLLGKAISDIVVVRTMPSVRNAQTGRDRVEQVQRNVHLAFALAAYQRDQGRYPARLDDLAPKYLTTIPKELFAAKPLIYRPTAADYLFYSIGENGQDDGGRWIDDDPPGDDPCVRMPLPELKRPK